MQNLKKIYRSDYAGEHIIYELDYKSGEWETTTEYVPNSVFSTHTTNQAVAIANGESRLGFDLSLIAKHKGGLFATNKLQSYGCNAVYRDFTPDFLIAIGPDTGVDDIVDEIAESGYTTDKIVYTNAHGLLKHPGKFYLVPQNLYYDSGSLAMYLACFDGHKKVYMLGYDNYQGSEPTNNVYKNTSGYPKSTDEQNGRFWELSALRVMETYADVEFVRVMPTTNWWTPVSWQRLVNFRQISYNDFVLEADIG
jgi:hypothetical protein